MSYGVVQPSTKQKNTEGLHTGMEAFSTGNSVDTACFTAQTTEYVPAEPSYRLHFLTGVEFFPSSRAKAAELPQRPIASCEGAAVSAF